MVKEFKDCNYWGLILGGSSGLGFASAKKLAAHGMNIIIIHRDRKDDLPEIKSSFEEIRELGVKVYSFNVDATRKQKREELAKEITDILGEKGKNTNPVTQYF